MLKPLAYKSSLNTHFELLSFIKKIVKTSVKTSQWT